MDADEDASKYQGHAYTFMAFDEAGNRPTSKPIGLAYQNPRFFNVVHGRLWAPWLVLCLWGALFFGSGEHERRTGRCLEAFRTRQAEVEG